MDTAMGNIRKFGTAEEADAYSAGVTDTLDRLEGQTEIGKPEEETLTYSEHERILKEAVAEITQRHRDENRDGYARETALEQAIKIYVASSTQIGPVIEVAQEYLSFLSGEAPAVVKTQPDVAREQAYNGLAAELIHAKGYQNGAADRQILVLRQVSKLLREEFQRYSPDQQVSVKQVYDRVDELLGTANWEF